MSRVVRIRYDWCPYKKWPREDGDTERGPCEEEDWSDASTSQGVPRTA